MCACALQRYQQDKNITGKIKEGKESQNRENLMTMFLQVLLLGDMKISYSIRNNQID